MDLSISLQHSYANPDIRNNWVFEMIGSVRMVNVKIICKNLVFIFDTNIIQLFEKY